MPHIDFNAAWRAGKVIGKLERITYTSSKAGHGMGRPSQWLQSILTVVDWYERFRVK